MRKLLVLLLAVLLMASFATVAFAEEPTETGSSQVSDHEFTIEIILDLENPEDYETITVEEGDEFVLKPVDKEGYEFDGYEIEGEYEVVSKDGNTWTIKPHGSLVIHIKYKEVEPKPTPHDDEPVSPPTGFNTVLFTVMVLVGLFGVVFAAKKLVKSH